MRTANSFLRFLAERLRKLLIDSVQIAHSHQKRPTPKTLSTLHEIDVPAADFCHLVDINDQSDPQRKVWTLVEKDFAGIAVHIFPEDPFAEISAVERGGSLWSRMKSRLAILLSCSPCEQKKLLIPYIPYSAAMIGIQIEIRDNAVVAVIWDPVPGEDDFNEDPDAPENPTVQTLIPDIDAYLPIKYPHSDTTDENGEDPHDDDSWLDEHPF